MASTPKGKSYEVLAGSPKISTSKESMARTEVWKMTWNDAMHMPDEMFPPPKWVGGFLVAQPPLSISSSGVALFAESVNWEPFDSDFTGGEPTATPWAAVTVVFKSRTEDDDNEEATLLTHNITIGGEFMTLPNTGMKYGRTGNPVANEDIKAAKVIPSLEHDMAWDFVPIVPYAAIRNCIGTVNGTAFFGAAPETLLFSGCDISRQVTTDGTKPWKVSYKFSEKAVNFSTGLGGWNHFYDPLNVRWDYLLAYGKNDEEDDEPSANPINGQRVYERRNFSSLFS